MIRVQIDGFPHQRHELFLRERIVFKIPLCAEIHVRNSVGIGGGFQFRQMLPDDSGEDVRHVFFCKPCSLTPLFKAFSERRGQNLPVFINLNIIERFPEEKTLGQILDQPGSLFGIVEIRTGCGLR